MTYAIPGAGTAGLIAAIITAEVTTSEPVVAGVGLAVAVVAFIVWVTTIAGGLVYVLAHTMNRM